MKISLTEKQAEEVIEALHTLILCTFNGIDPESFTIIRNKTLTIKNKVIKKVRNEIKKEKARAKTNKKAR